MSDPNRGLYEKFRVERTDGRSAPGAKHDGCRYFVLDLDHDPHAVPALEAYAESCREDFPELAKDLTTEAAALVWIDDAPARAASPVITEDGQPDAPPTVNLCPPCAAEVLAARLPCRVHPISPVITEEMVTNGLEAAKRWGFRVVSPVPDNSATAIFECGEHPRTFIQDVLEAALAAGQPDACPTCGEGGESPCCSNPFHLLRAGYTFKDGVFQYTLSFYGGCPDCETPAGLIVTRFSDTEAASWDVLDLPEAPWITADKDMREVAVPFLEFSYRAISRTFDEWWNEVRERKDGTENE